MSCDEELNNKRADSESELQASKKGLAQAEKGKRGEELLGEELLTEEARVEWWKDVVCDVKKLLGADLSILLV